MICSFARVRVKRFMAAVRGHQNWQTAEPNSASLRALRPWVHRLSPKSLYP